MSDPKSDPPLDLGIYSNQQKGSGLTAAEYIAIALSLLWIGGVAIYFYVLDTGEVDVQIDNLNFIITLLAVFMPVALIWVGAAAARSSRIMREESARLQAAIDAMRHTYVSQTQGGALAVSPSVARKLDEIATVQKQTETTLATFTSSRDATGDRQSETKPAMARSADVTGEAEDQTTLALGTRAEDIAPPVSVADFVRALHFPETADDEEGFRALRRALRDRKTARLVQASQDVLTLLSQDGIYMDDLRPDRAKPEVWRKFAQGERGRPVAALGGIRDRSCLALTAGRMRQDPIFRDAAHHFLRQFDKTFVEFETTATDSDIAKLGDTRTARAFMLLGRVTGTFD